MERTQFRRLALILPSNAAFCDQLATGVADSATAHGVSMSVYRYETEADIAVALMPGFDGILLWPPNSQWRLPDRMDPRTRFTLLMRESEHLRFDLTLLAKEIGEFGATAPIPLAFVGDLSTWSKSDPVQALVAKNIFAHRFIIEGHERALERLILHGGRPAGLSAFLEGFYQKTLVVCANSQCANLVARTAAALGLPIPSRIALACLADDYHARLHGITSFEVPFGNIGKSACEHLLACLGNDSSIRRISFALKLRQRGSTLGLRLARSTVQRALEIIEQTACKGLRVVDVVNALETSQKTLNRQFKKQLGTTIGNKIRSVRIERAESLLHDSDLPVTGVAVECGFKDPAKFCSFFKRETGKTPSEYRSASRSGQLDEGSSPP